MFETLLETLSRRRSDALNIPLADSMSPCTPFAPLWRFPTHFVGRASEI